MLFLIVVEWKTPDVCLIWFAPICLEAHPQHREGVAHQRLLHRLRLHEVVIVLEGPGLQDEHIAEEKDKHVYTKCKRKVKVICLFPLPSISNLKVVFIDGFSSLLLLTFGDHYD